MSMIEQSSFGSSLAVDALLAERCGVVKQHPGSIKSQSDINVVIAQTSSSRVDVYKSLTVKSTQDDLVITHMMRTRPGHGMTEPQAKRAAYAACVHLDEFSAYDVWCDEKHDSESRSCARCAPYQRHASFMAG